MDETLLERVDTMTGILGRETKLTERQAEALILKVVLGVEGEELAELLGVSSNASASSYVSKSRNKFDEADDRIDELEREIEQWKNTNELKDVIRVIIARDEERERGMEIFQKLVDERVASSSRKYFVLFENELGEYETSIIHQHPDSIDSVVNYKEIDSVDELFE